MVITGINLQSLLRQYEIVPAECFDQFSLTLHLDRKIVRYKYPSNHIFTYGNPVKDANIEHTEIDGEYILRHGQAILGCSKETVCMPKGFMGFIQTKGSLARLFISVHCCDGQIEPGFEGKVTFELCNLGPLDVRLLPESPVAQLFVFQTSSDKEKYQGKYNGSATPTFSK